MTARIGVIGCGWWATYAHLPALVTRRDTSVVAVADADERRARAGAEAFGVPRCFASGEELLDAVELDAVIIATPNRHHYDLARRALERGLHVLVEKPMTIDPAEARALAVLARERGRELVVGYPMHYNKHALALRDVIREGAIGELETIAVLYASIVRELYGGRVEDARDVVFEYPVHGPDPRTYVDPARAGGGQGQSQVTHAAALLLFLTGLQVVDVAAFCERFELPVDLADVMAIRFGNGALATLTSTGGMTAGHQELVRYDIFGRSGHVTFDVNGGRATVHLAGGATRELPALPPAERVLVGAPASNLVDIVLHGAENGSPAEIGVAAVELVAAMYTAAGGPTP